ncbi:MAG: 3-isopropylmalate dehydratase large subunit [Alphaproteobacteria bacterium]|nr:3-isopropylmalate dehydratase large subunit [Alphaproteobacteria bacterium]
MSTQSTLFDKIWDSHVVLARGEQCLLYVDRHIVHDGSFHAFNGLRARGLKVRRPELTFGTPDHYVPTNARTAAAAATPEIRRMIETLETNLSSNGIACFGLDDERQGIVHVIGPEQGITLPGTILVCGDSHTSSHGALGCFSFGIGQSENMHVLATQTLWQTKPKSMRVRVDGRLGAGVTPKDVILAIIARIGAGGAVGHVIEYAGTVFEAMSVEGRLTVCNMSIEAGARAGLVAPDETTIAYLKGRPFAPKGADWDKAVAAWRGLRTDDGARFDKEVTLDAGALAPMVTWGTSPEDALPITAAVPDAKPSALAYMGLVPGTKLTDIAVDRVFIGSCTNSRIEDLRAAAAVAKGRTAAVPTLVVPGSGLVKKQAEAEGLDAIFRAAGFEWRHAGCSMCVGINGETGRPQERIASTSNRNFEGRQGKGVRTHLMSPAMAAATAVTGRLCDVRALG